jgi:hypothetical protein
MLWKIFWQHFVEEKFAIFCEDREEREKRRQNPGALSRDCRTGADSLEL